MSDAPRHLHSPSSLRPVIHGAHGMVASEHYLATAAGFSVLERGGNAVDAAATVCFCLHVLEPHQNGIAGECPILVRWAEDGRVYAVNGQGWAPQAATIPLFRSLGIDLIPGDGLLPATVPAVIDAWVRALQRFGTWSLRETLSYALELAEGGVPMYLSLAACIEANQERFAEEWPTSAAVYLPEGRPPRVGETFRNPAWARTVKTLADAEARHAGAGREAALEAARREFHEGEIARTVARWCREQRFRDASGKRSGGLLTEEDLAGYRGRVEDPVSVTYHGYRVHKCGPWTQGPVFLQQLNLLEGFDLAAMGHNSVEYLHTLIECAKLAFADREACYADPDFVEVPLRHLLSKEHAAERRTQLGDVTHPGRVGLRSCPPTAPGDTTHLDVVDRWGNMVSATPSGSWIQSSPVVEGLGFPLGTRGQMFHLDEDHVERLEPGKRPSTTLTPSLALAEASGLSHLAFGTPGGDCQDQWTVQFFLNVVHFGMNLQEAIDAPTVHSRDFVNSFYPHDAHPGVMAAEDRIPTEAIEGLRARGHLVELNPGWSHGGVLAVALDPATGRLSGAASPRPGQAYVMGR
ncbi:MAG: gamma-glutamyltransferase family protein [Armatimonadetes bacterium]|nr:gamma-glutamyltransferase family protein [Armatimonadota bacterium]